ncbi:hypothetical protein [Pseudonocardia lacus]|uniref:hypothetical protein n=1 Tax=Pseudonocardia lacus TaxID=2835865 RepID=UPI001BDCF46C|nr:hypothetical protein [Pseudonocardia lacus]
MIDLPYPATVVSMDVIGSSSGNRRYGGDLDAGLDKVIDEAQADFRYPVEHWFRRSDGDSVTLVADARVPKARILVEFLGAVELGLARFNEFRAVGARLRVRTGVAHGDVVVSPPHVLGAAVRTAARLRDCEPVRTQAIQVDDALTLAVSDALYQEVVVQEDLGLRRGDFREITPVVKDGVLTGWLRRPADPDVAVAGPGEREQPDDEPEVRAGPSVQTSVQTSVRDVHAHGNGPAIGNQNNFGRS